MSERKRQRAKTTGREKESKTRSRSNRWVIAVLVAFASMAALYLLVPSRSKNPKNPTTNAPEPGIRRFELEPEAAVFAAYGGSASCRDCHEEAFEQWQGSNHDLAERSLTNTLDGAAFEVDRTFPHGSQSTTVGRTNSQPCVRSLGLTGRPEDHLIARVIGHRPLRQFLVSAPGGRLQTLEASYDPASNEWFNVYGNEDRQPGEWGHWTGRGMNWNHMCASCHNTRVRKNYDPATDTYHTTMAEMTVGCEACHGPLKAHNHWQRQFGKSGRKDPTVAKLTKAQTLDNCGFCHARRSELTGDFRPGDSFFDHCDLAIVDGSETYYPDGQVREENYEYAAFLGSRMHFRGVICTDCHNPHSLKTILPGNWLCLRCHNGSDTNAPVINPVLHSHHRVYGFDTNGLPTDLDLTQYEPKRIKETGGECVNCHMPQTVYMQRHWRHDHGFTIPDPLLTKQFGIPNACSRCHQDKSVDWALEAADKWYTNRLERVTRTRAQWLARARQGDPAARDPLLKMVREEPVGYWRAAAVELLEPHAGTAAVTPVLRKALDDQDPLVRTKAVSALGSLAREPGSPLAGALAGKLEDPLRAVRAAAAMALRLGPETGSRGAAEYAYGLRLNSDQPAGQMNLAVLAQARGDMTQAVAHTRKAVGWDPGSTVLRRDLAVLLSQTGSPAEALEQLQVAIKLTPRDAEFRFLLALVWSELGNSAEALRALEMAVNLDPNHVRAWYNLGLARNAAGDPESGIAALARAESLVPEDPQAPYARATIHARLGQTDRARTAAQRVLELAPGHAAAKQLLNSLDGR